MCRRPFISHDQFSKALRILNPRIGEYMHVTFRMIRWERYTTSYDVTHLLHGNNRVFKSNKIPKLPNYVKNVGVKEEKIDLILVTNSENLLMKLKFGCNYRTFVNQYYKAPTKSHRRKIRLEDLGCLSHKQ